MPGPEIRNTIRSTRGIIERQVSTALGQLEAATGAVEVRKLLHAAFIRQAILSANDRLPDNDALTAAIDDVRASLQTPDGGSIRPAAGLWQGSPDLRS